MFVKFSFKKERKEKVFIMKTIKWIKLKCGESFQYWKMLEMVGYVVISHGNGGGLLQKSIDFVFIHFRLEEYNVRCNVLEVLLISAMMLDRLALKL